MRDSFFFLHFFLVWDRPIHCFNEDLFFYLPILIFFFRIEWLYSFFLLGWNRELNPIESFLFSTIFSRGEKREEKEGLTYFFCKKKNILFFFRIWLDFFLFFFFTSVVLFFFSFFFLHVMHHVFFCFFLSKKSSDLFFVSN